MNSTEENIQLLSRTILDEAQEDAKQLLIDAKAKGEAIQQRGQETAEKERNRILENAHQDADRIRGQLVAATELKARTMQLEMREKLLNDVFEAVKAQLPDVQRWNDYDQIAKELLREGLARLKTDKAVFHADARTLQCLTPAVIAGLSSELKIEIQPGEPLQHGIGVVVATVDGHVHYDNTLENRLKRSMDAMRSPVYRILMGEML